MQAEHGKVISRTVLYDQVWSTPMTKLAKQYGYSDVGLRKLCIKHEIPTPSVGFWAQKQFGKAPEPTPLPECNDPQLQTVTFTENKPVGRNKPAPIHLDDDIRAVMDKCQLMPRLQPADDFRKLHPSVRRTKDLLEDSSTDFNGMKHCANYDQSGVFQVSVTKECIKRAVLFLDALVKGLEAIGAILINDPKRHEKSVWFGLCNECVWSLKLRERVKRVAKKHDPSKLWDSQYTFVPTGQLILARDGYENEVCRDSPNGKHRIEESINEVLVKFIEATASVRAHRLHEIERRKAEANRQRQIDELRMAQDKEREKLAQLMEYSETWNKSQQLRKFIQAYEDTVAEKGSISERVQTYLNWAKAQADRLDPLCESPASILDERIR